MSTELAQVLEDELLRQGGVRFPVPLPRRRESPGIWAPVEYRKCVLFGEDLEVDVVALAAAVARRCPGVVVDG